jgi:hypothetical protein
VNAFHCGFMLAGMAVLAIFSMTGCSSQAEPKSAEEAIITDALAHSSSFDALANALKSEPLRTQLSTAVPGWSMNFHHVAILDGTLNGTPTCQQETIWRLDVPTPQTEFEASLPKVFAALEASITQTAAEFGGKVWPGELTRNADGKLSLLITYQQGTKVGWLRVAQRKDQWSDLWLHLSEEPR